MSYIIAIILFLILIFMIISLAKWTIKTAFVIIGIFGILSLVTFFVQPDARKPFRLNVIEKILKINSDGSTTIIQTTTTEELKQK